LFRERGAERLPTAAIVAALGGRLGRPISAHRLARTLGPYGAAPRQFRAAGRRMWGYYRHDLPDDGGDAPAPIRAAEPPVERRDADRVDAEHEWAARLAMMRRGGRG
jgi:hypothetical protein